MGFRFVPASCFHTVRRGCWRWSGFRLLGGRGWRHVVFDGGSLAGKGGQAVEGGRQDLGGQADGQQAPSHAVIVVQQAGARTIWPEKKIFRLVFL
jgi:hypothetical protein